MEVEKRKKNMNWKKKRIKSRKGRKNENKMEEKKRKKTMKTEIKGKDEI